MKEKRAIFWDNTRVSDYRTCPRKYYFRHVRNWAPVEKSPALVFGLSWHSAMATLWELASSHKEMDNETLVAESYKSFYKTWLDEGFPESEVEAYSFYPRSPGRALQMLKTYVEEKRIFLSNIELLGNEESFVVPLEENNFYIGRFDKVYKRNEGVFIGEHKTTKSFSSTWIESFTPSSQIDGYLYAGYITYENFRGLIVDGALVQKNKIEFMDIPVLRQLSLVEEWLGNTRDWINRILFDIELLYSVTDSDKYLQAFPMNTSNCVQYGRMCPYKDICRFYSNPLAITDVPIGLKEEKWQPFDEAKFREEVIKYAN